MEPILPPRKLCIPRKRHECRVCGTFIQKGEPCERWTGVEQGEGWWTCHAHPECLDLTVTEKWDEGDWENSSWEWDTERPLEKRKCLVCHAESALWIPLAPMAQRPRYVCSAACFHNYCAEVAAK